jgi:hypothetical protein
MLIARRASRHAGARVPLRPAGHAAPAARDGSRGLALPAREPQLRSRLGAGWSEAASILAAVGDRGRARKAPRLLWQAVRRRRNSKAAGGALLQRALCRHCPAPSRCGHGRCWPTTVSGWPPARPWPSRSKMPSGTIEGARGSMLLPTGAPPSRTWASPVETRWRQRGRWRWNPPTPITPLRLEGPAEPSPTWRRASAPPWLRPCAHGHQLGSRAGALTSSVRVAARGRPNRGDGVLDFHRSRLLEGEAAFEVLPLL